jgi:hypothetical protein
MHPQPVVARRILASLLDAVIFVFLWLLTMAATGVTFPFAIMQSFSRADYDAYVRVMTWMTIGLFVLSLGMHVLLGASLGRLATGLKLQATGSVDLSVKQILLRSSYMFLLGLMILAPGPLIAFVYGKGSEGASLIALGLGFVLLVATTLGSRQSLIERWLGLETVRRR